jgi:ribosome-associated protein
LSKALGTIRVTPHIAIDERDLDERFVLASGPGGQNVNKVATAVQLRFDTHALADEVKTRLAKLAGRRLTDDGIVIITARQHRTQERNRADARARLFDLIRQAGVRPKKRKATRPTKASKERRIETKKVRGALKRTRTKRIED